MFNRLLFDQNLSSKHPVEQAESALLTRGLHGLGWAVADQRDIMTSPTNGGNL